MLGSLHEYIAQLHVGKKLLQDTFDSSLACKQQLLAAGTPDSDEAVCILAADIREALRLQRLLLQRLA
jgi:hypothetical protein